MSSPRCPTCGGTGGVGSPEVVANGGATCLDCPTCAEWRAVPGWAGYAVTTEGQIRGPSGKILQPMRNEAGYCHVIAHRRKLFVHRAILLTFVGPCPTGYETRHLDGNPGNNRVANLAWGTDTENADDKRRHGRQPYGERLGTAKLTEADVRELRALAGSASLREFGRRYGVSHTTIRRAINGMKWGHIT